MLPGRPLTHSPWLSPVAQGRGHGLVEWQLASGVEPPNVRLARNHVAGGGQLDVAVGVFRDAAPGEGPWMMPSASA